MGRSVDSARLATTAPTPPRHTIHPKPAEPPRETSPRAPRVRRGATHGRRCVDAHGQVPWRRERSTRTTSGRSRSVGPRSKSAPNNRSLAALARGPKLARARSRRATCRAVIVSPAFASPMATMVRSARAPSPRGDPQRARAKGPEQPTRQTDGTAGHSMSDHRMVGRWCTRLTAASSSSFSTIRSTAPCWGWCSAAGVSASRRCWSRG